jgi:glycosyltransferase involved in cell wall biosynthesis
MRLTLSVAVCTYNGERFLHRQLLSILEQQLPVDDIVICDDASTDNTFHILEQFQQKHPFVITVQRNPVRLGARRNFENALLKCKGDIIFLSDQDDEWLPSKTKITVEHFNRYPNSIAAFSDGFIIDFEGQMKPYSLWDAHLFNKTVRESINCNELFLYQLINPTLVTGATLAIRNSALNVLSPFFTPLHYWHDYWIGLKAASVNGLFQINEKLIRYREHCGQQTGTSIANPIQGRLYKVAWDEQFESQLQEELVRHYAFALTRLELFKNSIAKDAVSNEKATEAAKFLACRFKSLKSDWLKQLPYVKRKTKLLKHWLKGGEYLRITLKDVISI